MIRNGATDWGFTKCRNRIGHVGNPNHVVTLPFENSAAKSQVDYVVLNAQYQRFPGSVIGRRSESLWLTKRHPWAFGGRSRKNLNRPLRIAGNKFIVNTWNCVFVSESDLSLTAWLCGIGFTMWLFTATLAFDDGGLLNMAKMGVLAASLASGICASLFLTRQNGSTIYSETGRVQQDAS